MGRGDSQRSRYLQESNSVWHLGEDKMENKKLHRERNLKIIIHKLTKALTSKIVLENLRLPLELAEGISRMSNRAAQILANIKKMKIIQVQEFLLTIIITGYLMN